MSTMLFRTSQPPTHQRLSSMDMHLGGVGVEWDGSIVDGRIYDKYENSNIKNYTFILPLSLVIVNKKKKIVKTDWYYNNISRVG